jgi:predicted permease
MLGEGAIPAALLAVGMSLNTLSFRENAAEIAWISSVRVILSPVLALFCAKLFGLPPVFAIALVVSFSLPTAKMVLPLADENGIYVQPAAGIIALTTVSLAIVWPLVLWVCEYLWPGVIGGNG